MEGLGENDQCLIGPLQGLREGNSMESDKYALDISNNRQALRDISHTVGNTPQPCAVTKRPLTEWILKHDVVDKNLNNVRRQKMNSEHDVVDKNLNNVGYQLMTRKSVASPADGLPICQQPQESNTRDDVIEVEKLKDKMLDKMEEMDNRELEEIEREYVVLDIDTCDVKNPLEVVEYVEDLYIFYQQAEVAIGVSPDYISIQYDINEKMRAILVDWLVEVHYKFELMDETLFLTVNLIDRFLERQIVVRKKLQLVGVTAMLLACKYQDVSVPSVEDLIRITDRAYTRNEVLEMEMLMLNTLQFEMCVPTPYVFMKRFLKAAEADIKMKHLSFFMTELCLVEYEMLKFRPSFLAAAATYTAQCTLRGFKYWSRTSQLHTNYAEDQLLECSRLMVDFHQRAGTGQLAGVYRKYITFRYGCAAKSKPALFLLD